MPPVREANGAAALHQHPDRPVDGCPRRAGRPGPLRPGRRAFYRTHPAAARYYPQHNNWQPRASAWPTRPKGEQRDFPNSSSAQGKTSIRAGAGMYYDLIGQPLAGFIASNSFGLSTSLSTPPNVYTSRSCRATPASPDPARRPMRRCSSRPAPKAGFPVSYPERFRHRQFAGRPSEGALHHEPELQRGARIQPRLVRAGCLCRPPVAPQSGAARPGNADQSERSEVAARLTSRR